MISAIKAERIWRMTGHPTYPWEVGHWPDEWLDTLYALDVGVEKWRGRLTK